MIATQPQWMRMQGQVSFRADPMICAQFAVWRGGGGVGTGLRDLRGKLIADDVKDERSCFVELSRGQ